MKKWSLLAQSKTRDGGTLTLNERDGQYTIRLNGLDLMSNRESFSEIKLAELGCELVKEKGNARVLIGGLGLGFTLRATLEQLFHTAEVVVAELSPDVIAWNQNPEYPFAAKCLKDKRVRLVQEDVRSHVRDAKARYDVIMLDVDNGPAALTVASNKELYDDAGVQRLKAALKPKGRLVVWSVDDDPSFTKRLVRQGFEARAERVRSRETSGGHRVLFVGDAPK